jgi:hypothetical protein
LKKEDIERQIDIALQKDKEYKKMIEENNPIAGHMVSATFICPDCLTQIFIKTRLKFELPFRMACPCKYSGMHRATEWVIEEE